VGTCVIILTQPAEQIGRRSARARHSGLERRGGFERGGGVCCNRASADQLTSSLSNNVLLRGRERAWCGTFFERNFPGSSCNLRGARQRSFSDNSKASLIRSEKRQDYRGTFIEVFQDANQTRGPPPRRFLAQGTLLTRMSLLSIPSRPVIRLFDQVASNVGRFAR